MHSTHDFGARRWGWAVALGLTILGCGDDGFSSAEDAELATATSAVTDDPTWSAPYGACLHKHKYQGMKVRVYFPCGHTAPSPLAVAFRAKGDELTYSFKNFNYLLKHLARNGYVAASIDYVAPDSDLPGGVQLMRGFLDDDLRGSWYRSDSIDPSKLALIGHSRGGELARGLADDLASGAHPWNVRALVNFASSGASTFLPSGATTSGLLILQATEDGDVGPDQSFKLFDTSGAPPAAFTSMKLIEGGGHSLFTTSVDPEPDSVRMVKGYVLAFLEAHVRSTPHHWYDQYIRGEDVPHGWPGMVANQYRDAFRHVVDSFEDGTVGNNDLGGGVFRSGVQSSVIDLGTSTASGHDTQALQVLGLNGESHITWRVPSGQGAVSHLQKLSLRIGQISGPPATGLTVQIRNDGVWSPEVALTDWGSLVQPMAMCTQSTHTPLCADQYMSTQWHMGTIAIPVTELGPTNDVERVRLRFRNDAIWKNYLVDDVAFVEELAWP